MDKQKKGEATKRPGASIRAEKILAECASKLTASETRKLRKLSEQGMVSRPDVAFVLRLADRLGVREEKKQPNPRFPVWPDG